MQVEGTLAALSGDLRAAAVMAGSDSVDVVGASSGALLPAAAGLLLLFLLLLLWQRVHAAIRGFMHMRKVIADMPGPPTLPLLGNVLDIVGGGDDFIYDNCRRLMERFGPTMRLWLGPELVVAISDPRDVEFLCTSQELTDKSSFYTLLEPLLGLGISCLSGQEVRHHRKIVMPSLHLDILQDFMHAFNREARNFAERLQRHADDGEVFDVAPLCVEHSLAAALQTIMSTEVGVIGEQVRSVFGGWMHSGMDTFMYRVWRPWFFSDALFRVSGRHAEYMQSQLALNSFTETIIAEKRQKLDASRQRGEDGAAAADAPKKRRRAFLDNVLDCAEGAALTNREIRDEVKTLLCTGSETSASTLSFILLVLALRQDVQDKLVQELDDVYGDDLERPLTLEELRHLDYLERVIKETLRLFPVLPFFARHCPRDVTLPSGGTAPRGAHLAFFLPELHSNPSTWGADARHFDPDRFLPERSRGRHPFSYIPFSAGARNCVGQRYAMMLMKVEVATLLLRFRVLPPADQPPLQVADVPIQVTLVIAVRGGVKIRVRRRQPRPSRTPCGVQLQQESSL